MAPHLRLYTLRLVRKSFLAKQKIFLDESMHPSWGVLMQIFRKLSANNSQTSVPCCAGIIGYPLRQDCRKGKLLATRTVIVWTMQQSDVRVQRWVMSPLTFMHNHFARGCLYTLLHTLTKIFSDYMTCWQYHPWYRCETNHWRGCNNHNSTIYI